MVEWTQNSRKTVRTLKIVLIQCPARLCKNLTQKNSKLIKTKKYGKLQLITINGYCSVDDANESNGFSKQSCCCMITIGVCERENLIFGLRNRLKSRHETFTKRQESASPSRSCCVPELVVWVCLV